MLRILTFDLRSEFRVAMPVTTSIPHTKRNWIPLQCIRVPHSFKCCSCCSACLHVFSSLLQNSWLILLSWWIIVDYKIIAFLWHFFHHTLPNFLTWLFLSECVSMGAFVWKFVYWCVLYTLLYRGTQWHTPIIKKHKTYDNIYRTRHTNIHTFIQRHSMTHTDNKKA
jgi:hypothetical protein